MSARGYAVSREAARKSIDAGLVAIDGRRVRKPSEQIDENSEHSVEYRNVVPYVSRGGSKLEEALRVFNIDVTGMTAVDIGASTGGFTDCLLRHGANKVYAVDSGHGQLSPVLEKDPRVVSVEGKNARELVPEDIGEPCDIAVMDVSFISQTLILPQIPALLKPGGVVITLIKPQFEAGRGSIGKGGIVRRQEDRRRAIIRVLVSAQTCGLWGLDVIPSPICGGDGNKEYLAVFCQKDVVSSQTHKDVEETITIEEIVNKINI